MILANRVNLAAVLAAFVALAGVDASAMQDAAGPKKKKPSTQPTTTTSAPTTTSTSTTSSTSAPSEEEADRFLAVVGGEVHTVTGPVLEAATVLSKNGKIVAIGADVKLPPECEVVDASGKRVYPGLIAAGAFGFHEGASPDDETNVFGLNLRIGNAVGITTALSGNNVAKLTFGSAEDILIRQNAYMALNLPRRKPLVRARLRADLERVRDYVRKFREYGVQKRTDKDAKPPDKAWLKGKFENYRKLLAHETVAVTNAGPVQQLRDLAALARHFDFQLVIRGAYEGWLAADELGRAGVDVILTPRADITPDEHYSRQTGSTIENARILHDAGVTVAVVPRIPVIFTWGVTGQDLMHLNMEAAFAVRGGMSNDDALRTITIDAARILGVDERVGSLEVGKDADLIVTDGDVLHYMTLVHYTVVNGRIAYDKSADTLFAHIRPDGKPEVAQFDDIWPRRLEWPAAELRDPAEAPRDSP